MSNAYQVDEARKMGVCRICHEPISVQHAPGNWEFAFGEMLFPPPAVTLNFGAEFAHTACLERVGEPTYDDYKQAKEPAP